MGDACDADDDGDRFDDRFDLCPFHPNPDQTDSDRDGLGDACDPDRDGDGVPNAVDNCPDHPNADQANADGRRDGGDACDPILNPPAENCAEIFDPLVLDTDDDGLNDHSTPMMMAMVPPISTTIAQPWLIPFK